MQVLKFGGTSVANAQHIKKVSDIVARKSTGKLIVIVSALSGTTDKLLRSGMLASEGNQDYKKVLQELLQQHLDVVRELLPLNNQSGMLSFIMQQFNEVEDICNGILLLNEFSDRTRDRIVSYGELISSQIVSHFFNFLGMKNTWVDSRICIKTDSSFTKAAVQFQKTQEKLKHQVDQSVERIIMMPGFISSDDKGNTTTLGRGGSDYTAAIVGAAVEASVVEIWTDVSGMMTADPRHVNNAKPIREISYNEAMELSHFGARVIYPPTIQPLMDKKIPVWIKNTFAPDDEGTVINAALEHSTNITRGISSINRIALLSLEGSGMVGIPGFSKRLFETLASHNINVILITQASSEHSICVGVEEQFAAKAKRVIDAVFDFEIEKNQVNPLVIENAMSIIALVGDQMKSHPGISGRMFGVLGRNGVNVRAIAQGSSERNISAVIASADILKALNVLHEEFFEATFKQLNLYVTGTGNVGSKLLGQIGSQQKFLQQHLRIQVRIVGLANSRKMIFSDDGIDLDNWKKTIENGEKMDMSAFIQRMHEKNLRNSVFVDVTASESVAATYEHIFMKSISVVACNKIACSSPYSHYKKLKDLSRDYNSSFLFETNVGASLPIIGTLNDLLHSGDRITKIEAVLSGTLNYVFNYYNGEKSFSEIVKMAQDEGYTEPDPRLDLSGTDVMRKIMILARESGDQMEMEDITNHTFLPQSCMRGSVEDFYHEMKNHETHFRRLFSAAEKEGKKLKFVATYENGKAEVGLKHIDPQHDFYRLYGKDNIVLFYTDRYVDQPMVIKGAGAGAEVTASGVFADIIRTATI